MTETAPQLQPLYLLADSQLLFWKRQDRLLLEAALDALARDTPLSAAYIGASNGDRPEFYGIFKAAVDARRPICPVAVRGARQILRDGNYLPRPGRVTVTFGPLIEPNPEAGDDWREIVRLRDATRKIIAGNTGEPMI